MTEHKVVVRPTRPVSAEMLQAAQWFADSIADDLMEEVQRRWVHRMLYGTDGPASVDLSGSRP